MKLRAVLSCLAALVASSAFSHASAETVQTAANVFGGHPYLYVQAESFSSLTGDPAAGWKVVTKGGPDVSVVTSGTGLPILPTTSNVSGSAIWAQTQRTDHSQLATYQLKFITPGTYQFYLRQTQYDFNGNGNFLNEDSVFLPPAFNKNSSTDWVGFPGLEFDENDVTVDIPNPGFALDPDGYKASVGNHQNDGLLELANWGIKSKGVWTQHNASGTLSANGNFNWYNRPTYQGVTATGGFDGFFGMKTEFTVDPAMVGQTVTFELGTREIDYVLDGFMFIKMGTPADIYPDQDLLDLYTQEEVDSGVLPQPIGGDYNNNGVVDAADYVLWRKGGPLANEVDTPGTVNAADYTAWRARFGNGSSGSGLGASAVPEPTTLVLFVLGLAAFPMNRRRPGR